MSENEKSCETCRFNIDNDNYMAGGDCINCDETLSEWMELKRVNPLDCKFCKFEFDPCHYICVECQDNKNFTPRKTVREEIHSLIEKKEREIKELERKLKNCTNLSFIQKVME